MDAEKVRCASCRTTLRHGSADGAWFGPAGYALCADCRFEVERRGGEPNPDPPGPVGR